MRVFYFINVHRTCYRIKRSLLLFLARFWKHLIGSPYREPQTRCLFTAARPGVWAAKVSSILLCFRFSIVKTFSIFSFKLKYFQFSSHFKQSLDNVVGNDLKLLLTPLESRLTKFNWETRLKSVKISILFLMIVDPNIANQFEYKWYQKKRELLCFECFLGSQYISSRKKSRKSSKSIFLK